MSKRAVSKCDNDNSTEWYSVMHGVTGKTYETKCNSHDEALELARNNRALGFDA